MATVSGTANPYLSHPISINAQIWFQGLRNNKDTLSLCPITKTKSRPSFGDQILSSTGLLWCPSLRGILPWFRAHLFVLLSFEGHGYWPQGDFSRQGVGIKTGVKSQAPRGSRRPDRKEPWASASGDQTTFGGLAPLKAKAGFLCLLEGMG